MVSQKGIIIYAFVADYCKFLSRVCFLNNEHFFFKLQVFYSHIELSKEKFPS